MNSDELERRLRRLDPMDGVSVEPDSGPRAAALMEQIMNTPLDIDPVTEIRTDPVPAPRRWPKFAIGGGIAAAVAGGAIAVASIGGGGATATSVTYSLGANDPMAMCLPVADYQPSPGLVGFRGTVVGIGNGDVTLDVTKWYGGGDADRVVLDVTDVASPALDGVDFTQGGDYLVGVQDGAVLTCGISGPASPDLATLYDGWFAG